MRGKPAGTASAPGRLQATRRALRVAATGTKPGPRRIGDPAGKGNGRWNGHAPRGQAGRAAFRSPNFWNRGAARVCGVRIRYRVATTNPIPTMFLPLKGRRPA